MERRNRIRHIGCLLGWCALVLLIVNLSVTMPPDKFGSGLVNLFSYFTVLSNLMVVLALTLPLTFSNPILRGAVALYITITCLLYFLLLRNTWSPHGAQWLSEVLMHYVMPPIYLYLWLRGPRGGRLQWKHVLYWLGFPLVFAVYTLIHGEFSGFYPYYFLDASKAGYGPVLLNMLWLTGVFLVVGAGIVAVDRKLPR